MKKTLCIIIHLICVLVLAAGTFVILGHSSTGYGLMLLQEARFEDSSLFSEMVDDDISNLKRYAVLLSTFEGYEGEEPNLDKSIVSAITSNGSVNYTMSDLLTQAGRYGFFMDDSTHAISYLAPAEEPTSFELRIVYKEYDPYYLDRLPYGPSQGVSDIRSLALDAMRALAEYYTFRNVYDTEISNFYYRAYFVTDGDQEFQIENNTLNADEIKNLGKYIIVTSRGTIETNIVPQPENILESTETYEFMNGGEENVLEIGVDTTYIFNDRYRQGQETLDENRREVYFWLGAIILAILLGLTSFIFMIRGFGREDNKEREMDRIPLGALIFLCVCFSIIIYFILRYLFNNLIISLFSDSELPTVRMILRIVLVWICSLPIIGSLYRRGTNGGIFKYSLVSGIMNVLSENSLGNAAWEAAKGYLVFTAVNILLIAGIFYFFSLSEITSSYNADMAMNICIVILIAFDILVYVILYRRARQKVALRNAIRNISAGDMEDVHLDESEFSEDRLGIARDLNNISDGLKNAVNEQVKADRLRTDLITNVSHDIRTPLTSIINYVDLMKRENVEDSKLREYIGVLDQKSDRLKKLTEDLLEASKASSGNINLEMKCLNLGELADQAGGELMDKFVSRNLSLELDIPKEPVYVMADGRYLWRVFENLYNNAAKYSLKGTRVYVDVTKKDQKAVFIIKNISEMKLNISPDELTERFVRGEQSRNTEGSGLGLSIAQSLIRLMDGELVIQIDGDLYKASVIMNLTKAPKRESDAKEDVETSEDESDAKKDVRMPENESRVKVNRRALDGASVGEIKSKDAFNNDADKA